MTQRVRREAVITREMVRASPDVLFVFGDNMEGRGLGGQAAAMRGEPNAVGVPTKWRPDMRSGAFFSDDDMRNKDVRHALREAFLRLEAHLEAGGKVVLPADGLGTGLAQLPTRAPSIARYIDRWLMSLERYNERGEDAETGDA